MNRSNTEDFVAIGFILLVIVGILTLVFTDGNHYDTFKANCDNINGITLNADHKLVCLRKESIMMMLK